MPSELFGGDEGAADPTEGIEYGLVERRECLDHPEHLLDRLGTWMKMPNPPLRLATDDAVSVSRKRDRRSILSLNDPGVARSSSAFVAEDGPQPVSAEPVAEMGLMFHPNRPRKHAAGFQHPQTLFVDRLVIFPMLY